MLACSLRTGREDVGSLLFILADVVTDEAFLGRGLEDFFEFRNPYALDVDRSALSVKLNHTSLSTL